MASITISPVSSTPMPQSTTTVTGDEKLIVINKGGKTSTISVNQILDKLDDDLLENLDEQFAAGITADVKEDIASDIEQMVKEGLENVDPNANLNWNEVV